MPRSSRHKSHRQSKHSSKDYSDSEEDVKMKEKSDKDESTVRVYGDSTSCEKRKISSQVREGKDGKDLGGHGNGELLEEYVSSKRRKEKADITVGGDRWDGGGNERVDGDRYDEKDMSRGGTSKVDSRMKESSNKGENLRIESKSRSKRYESGSSGERKEESLPSVVVDKEETKSKAELKRKSERDSSGRKAGKESKDKDRRLEKEKNGDQEGKHVDTGVKLVDLDVGKKQGSQLRDFSEERLGKRARENTERSVQDELRNPELEKEIAKKMRRRRDSSTERDKHYDDSKESDDGRLSSRGDRAKDVKYRDDKHKDGSYADAYQEDAQKDDKHREEAHKDSKHRDDKYREGGERDTRRRDDRTHENGDRENRCKDEKYRKDGEQESRLKDEMYGEGTERDGQDGDDNYHEDGDRDRRRKDERYREDGPKDVKRGDERYHEDGNRDVRCRDNSYREDGEREKRHKEEKYREETERDSWRKDSKQGDGFDREKRSRETKYKDERVSRDRSSDKSDAKHSRDDGYAADHHYRKSSAFDGSPSHDDRTARYRDEQGRRRASEKEDYGDVRSRGTKDQRSDTEKKSTDRGRSTSRNADVELTSSHGRRWSSPAPSSHSSRDHYRVQKQDESKYRDYSIEVRVQHNMTSARDYAGAVGGPEKASSSRSLEKLGQKDDGHLGELPAERRLKPDINSSPLQQLLDKSPSLTTDRKQFSRSDVRRSIDVGESTQKSSGTRDVEYSGSGRGSREFAMDVLPGDELSQADADTLSVSSPFTRNNHFSSSSRSWPPPPPPFRTGVDNPLILGSADDDGRGKSRHRRIVDPNMGRIQGNPWRGVPGWPSPVANGFLPFPHAPPPVGFHSVMQPFPAPPMFSVRPSVELNHPAAYHMPDADRFSGPGRPMGWRNPGDDSCPPLHVWDTSNAVFGEESHIYGRPDWDHSRNLPGDRGWETSGDLWKGSNRTASLEMPSSERENNSTRTADEALAGQSIQPVQIEQTPADQQVESTEISKSSKSFEKNDVAAPLFCPEETSDVAKMPRKDDVHLCHVYLSKLDISADLCEPDLFNRCTGLIDTDQSIFSDIDDSKILYMEEFVDAKAAFPLKYLNSSMFTPTDESVFQKAMSLYKRQKENFRVEVEEKLKVLNELVPNSDPNIQDDKTEKLLPANGMHGVEDTFRNFDKKVDPLNSLEKADECTEIWEQKTDLSVANTTEKAMEMVSPLDHVNIEVNLVPDLGLEGHVLEENPLSVKIVEGSDAPLTSEEKGVPLESTRKNDNLKLLDAKCGYLLNSDVSSEASERKMPESVVSGSVNLSRIHHSSESTH